jgi:hypothetical protein
MGDALRDRQHLFVFDSKVTVMAQGSSPGVPNPSWEKRPEEWTGNQSSSIMRIVAELHDPLVAHRDGQRQDEGPEADAARGPWLNVWEVTMRACSNAAWNSAMRTTECEC